MPYPYYTNPYSNAYPISYGGSVSSSGYPIQQIQQPQYMINVDGENAAKAWQPTSVPQPNTIIPLFDSDGEHVYFKTYDAYGRMNPLRKGKIIFEDINETNSEQKAQDMSCYVTIDDLNRMKEELLNQINSIQGKTNQNGTSKSR